MRQNRFKEAKIIAALLNDGEKKLWVYVDRHNS